VSGLGVIATSSLLALLLSGGFLAGRISAWTLAWPKIALAALLLFGALGAVAGGRLRSIRRIGNQGKGIQIELASRLQDPLLKISLGIRIGLVFGIVLLMTATPGMLESLAAVGASMMVGLLAIFLLFGQRMALPAASSVARGD
jgi:hypothetical protein